MKPGPKKGTRSNNPNGRPKGEETKPLYRRVPVRLHTKCNEAVQTVLDQDEALNSKKKL